MREPDAETLPELVSRVVEDAKEVARAEVDLVKAQAGAKVAGYRTAVIFFAGAGVLALAALPTLLVGLILTLVQYMRVGPATTIVIAATLALAALLAWLGLRSWKRA